MRRKPLVVSAAEPLVLRHEAAGPRHYLAGRPVHAGTGLLLEGAGGSRIAGRYEWSFVPGELPVLVVTGMWGDTAVAIGDFDRLRWPDRTFGRP